MTGTGTVDDETVWTYISGSGEVGSLMDANKTEIVFGTTPKLNYWLGSLDEYSTDCEWYVSGRDLNFDYDAVDINDKFGLRPVVIALKSDI